MVVRGFLLFLFLTALITHTTETKAETGIDIFTGTVASISHECAYDGLCGFVLQTQNGPVNFVWNQGDVMPSVACPITGEVTYAAQHLNVGQKVEVHIPATSANHVLCGKQSAIIPLQD